MSILLTALTDTVAAVAADIPQPNPNPPIPEELKTKTSDVLGIAKWVLGPAGVIGLLIFAIRMAVIHNRGEGDQQLGSFGKIMLALVIGATAVGIVGFFLT